MSEESTCFVVIAFRFGMTGGFSFPIGVERTYEAAEEAARNHRRWRGGKYSHRIYEFPVGGWDDDLGHRITREPCIEDQ